MEQSGRNQLQSDLMKEASDGRSTVVAFKQKEAPMGMLYAAIDIHKRVFQAAVLDPASGEIAEARFPATRGSPPRVGAASAGHGCGGRRRGDLRLAVGLARARRARVGSPPR